jgi:DNA-binding CsgD family transcriptional regulator
MPNPGAPALELRDGDEQELQRLLRSTTAPAGLVQRARIVLLAAQGRSNTAIAGLVGVSRPTVIS